MWLIRGSSLPTQLVLHSRMQLERNGYVLSFIIKPVHSKKTDTETLLSTQDGLFGVISESASASRAAASKVYAQRYLSGLGMV